MPKAISLVNMKGGVGKSTLAVNLAWEYATAPWHKNVLLVDLDPQFNATQYTIGQAQYEQKVLKEQNPTVWDLFEQRSRLPGRPRKGFKIRDAILQVDSFRRGSLALLPSRLELAFSLRNPSQKETLLAGALSDVEDDYDVIIIDCPPTESLLTYAAYLASSHILVPVKPEYLSAIGLPLLRQSLADFRADNAGHPVRVAGVVFNSATEYEPEELRSKNEVRALAKQFRWKIFNHQVPYSRSFPKGAREGQPIFWTSYARSKPKQRLQGFAAEFATAIGLGD